MKLRNFLIMHYTPDNSTYRYDNVVAGTAKSALNQWRKTAGDKIFVRVEDMNGVVY